MKDWLGFENARNKKNAALYTKLLRAALKHDNVAVLIGHHITFELDGDLQTENEIPSADCLMFDHDLMTAAFGEHTALKIMINLALTPCEERDELLASYVEMMEISHAPDSAVHS